jgi:hypothetical protein
VLILLLVLCGGACGVPVTPDDQVVITGCAVSPLLLLLVLLVVVVTGAAAQQAGNWPQSCSHSWHPQMSSSSSCGCSSCTRAAKRPVAFAAATCSMWEQR